jgi:hypothetical protein
MTSPPRRVFISPPNSYDAVIVDTDRLSRSTIIAIAYSNGSDRYLAALISILTALKSVFMADITVSKSLFLFAERHAIPLIIGCVLAGAAIGAAIYTDQASKVVASMEVGQAVGAEHHPSSYGSSTTSVETTGGSFAVSGTFQLIKGNKMVVETRGTGQKKLCDKGQGVCSNLLK